MWSEKGRKRKDARSCGPDCGGSRHAQASASLLGAAKWESSWRRAATCEKRSKVHLAWRYRIVVHDPVVYLENCLTIILSSKAMMCSELAPMPGSTHIHRRRSSRIATARVEGKCLADIRDSPCRALESLVQERVFRALCIRQEIGSLCVLLFWSGTAWIDIMVSMVSLHDQSEFNAE